MTILLASGTPHLPQVVGGLETNTHEMAIELNRRGRPTAVLSKLSPRDLFGAARLLRTGTAVSDVAIDTALGYTVFRAIRPWTRLRGLPRPRVAVIQNGNMVEIGRRFQEIGVPSIAYLHGLEFEKARDLWSAGRAALPFSAYIANSRFTADMFAVRTGIEASVIPPIFRSERYRSPTATERCYVTFINPVREKGVEVALRVAELCPDIAFRFVRGWPLSLKAKLRLRARLAALPNVSMIGPCSDMAGVYASTRVLLVPSQWSEETWGRVASEAQYAGVPVVGSDHGGLRESIGPGGTVLPREADAGLWAEEIRSLHADNAYWAAKSSAALAHAARPELEIDQQMAKFLGIVDEVTA